MIQAIKLFFFKMVPLHPSSPWLLWVGGSSPCSRPRGRGEWVGPALAAIVPVGVVGWSCPAPIVPTVVVGGPVLPPLPSPKL